jgi:hypothetical protein
MARYKLGAAAPAHTTNMGCSTVGQQIAGCDPYDPCGWQMVAGCAENVGAGAAFSITVTADNGSPYFNGRAVYAWAVANADCTRNLRFTLGSITRGNDSLLSTTATTPECYLSDIFVQNACGPLYFPFGTFSTVGLAKQLTFNGTNICAEAADIYFTVFGDARDSC